MNRKSFKKMLILIIVVITAFSLAACGKPAKEKIAEDLENGRYAEAVQLYNDKIDAESEDGIELAKMFEERVGSSVELWASEEMTYDDASAMLEAFSALKSSEVADKAAENLEYIKIEHEGSVLLEKAETRYSEGEYLEAMTTVKGIDKAYSLYSFAADLYSDAKESYLFEISYPETVAEYEESIDEINAFLGSFSDEKLKEEVSRLENELTTFRYSAGIIDEAYEKYYVEEYKSAFQIIEKGLRDYPDDIHLKQEKENLETGFIVSVAEKLKPLIEEEKYDEALEVIDDAKNICDREELAYFEDKVKDEKSIFHKGISAAADVCNGIALGWKEEVAEVKRDGTAAYVYKSGKKLFLGNYSEDEVTILSTAGNIAISLAGVDFAADVRDVVYDVQNWGGEEYFVVHLALDTIAVIPVIGAVKYVKSAKKLYKTAGDGAKLVDNAVEAGEKAGIGIVRHYRHIDTINQNLLGQTSELGVPFVKVKTRDWHGNLVEGVFPKFEYKFETKLPKDMYLKTDREQFKLCNERLYEKITKDYRLKEKFTAEQIEQIKEGIKTGTAPDGYVWHHCGEEGKMQLVEAVIHAKTGHTGGRAVWGGGEKCRK